MTRLVFLDTETTGLDSDRCEIWEIGAIVRAPGTDDVEYEWQLRPKLVAAEPTGLRIGRYYQRSLMIRRQPDEALRTVHPDYVGYKPDDFERLVNIRSMAADLATMLDGAHIVGAVPDFDTRFLRRFLAIHGQALTCHYHLVDVETLAAGALRFAPPWDFDQLLARFGLSYDEADRHTALGDARMVRDLYDAVMQHADRRDAAEVPR